MRLFTKDTDDKFDTPLSLWVGLAFIGVALFFESQNIGPGGFSFDNFEVGINLFFFVVGLTAFVPGLFLTLWGKGQTK